MLARMGAGMALATGIGLQNMPEGLAVALPLVREKYHRRKALWYATNLEDIRTSMDMNELGDIAKRKL